MSSVFSSFDFKECIRAMNSLLAVIEIPFTRCDESSVYSKTASRVTNQKANLVPNELALVKQNAGVNWKDIKPALQSETSVPLILTFLIPISVWSQTITDPLAAEANRNIARRSVHKHHF